MTGRVGAGDEPEPSTAGPAARPPPAAVPVLPIPPPATLEWFHAVRGPVLPGLPEHMSTDPAPEALRDLERLAGGIEDAVAELGELAAKEV